MTQPLTLDVLADALDAGAAGLRAVTRLQPLGGTGDKVFPPTFGDTVTVIVDGQKHKTKYAVETRRIDGEDQQCVLLDSVASQANRMEEALQRAWDEGRANIPMVRVDFTNATDDDPVLDLSTLGGDGYITALEAPHRLADALLRDSMLGDLRFRASAEGRAFTEANPHNATAVYDLCPTALVFGMWDSTGPKGGQGSKFQRALVSEIVGVGIRLGRKTASRIDPAQIALTAGPIYQSKDLEEEWTVDESDAKVEKNKAVLFSRKKKQKPGRPSQINHGNIMPSIESEAGGVTLDYAVQTTVLSLPALRRLRFPRNVKGDRLDRTAAAAASNAARLTLAALGMAAVALQRDEGFDLRSRCAFAPEGPLAVEIVGRDGGVQGPYVLTSVGSLALLEEASAAAAKHGMGWRKEAIDLTPAPKLVGLIRKSRQVAAVSGDNEDQDEDA